MAELAQFEDSVTFHVKTCPRPIILSALKTVIMDFCKQSRIWVFDCDEITTTATDNKYQLNIPTDAAICYVHSFNGRHEIHPCNTRSQRRDLPLYHLQHPDTLVLDRKNLKPDLKYNLVVSLMPRQDALDCADIIYDKYKSTIVAGAVALLQLQPDTTWANAASAASQYALFAQGVADAQQDLKDGLELAAPDYRTTPYYF